MYNLSLPKRTLVVGAVVLTIAGLAVAKVAAGPPAEPAPANTAREFAADDRPGKLALHQRARRKEALGRLAKGQRIQERGGREVLEVGDEFVPRGPAKTGAILTFLVEFSNKQRYGGTPGPKHNQIPKPDRTKDNSTNWRPDFHRQGYADMFTGAGANTMADFYRQQSGGRYTVTGDVTDWITLPYNAARYGSNDHEQEGYGALVADTANGWVASQRAKGKSRQQIQEYLRKFDRQDRYDADRDGNFDEPDGYLDHVQVIHAGEGEEAGGGAQGADAIWSHRGYAFDDNVGLTGPHAQGGAPLADTGLWIGDYTTEPENGGLGVFCHEFGHDLGLPDLYDTSGQGENGVGFWSLMAAGSWLGDGHDSIGTKPGYLGAWEKWSLGWLDYQVAAAKPSVVELGPAERPGNQALMINLPDQTITTKYNQPTSGQYEWWSGAADRLNVSLSRRVDLRKAKSASLSAKAWYETEDGYDLLYVEASTDGRHWTKLDQRSGISPDWVTLTQDLRPYLGKLVDLRFRYRSDLGKHGPGAFLDDIALTVDGVKSLDDVENPKSAWRAQGWTRTTGTVTRTAPRFYLAENRQYLGYDEALRTGPYSFGFTSTRPRWVEHYPYQPGLVIWLVDLTWDDNNTSQHPGHGLALPIDARPAPLEDSQGQAMNNRRQAFDAAFGLDPAEEVTFHRDGKPTTVPLRAPVSRFTDLDPMRYWSRANPGHSVQVAGAGVSVRVIDGAGPTLTLAVTPPSAAA